MNNVASLMIGVTRRHKISTELKGMKPSKNVMSNLMNASGKLVMPRIKPSVATSFITPMAKLLSILTTFVRSLVMFFVIVTNKTGKKFVKL